MPEQAIDPTTVFSPRDLDRVASLGMTIDEVVRQLRLFERPPAHAQLLRPCTIGDGIEQLGADAVAGAHAAFGEACGAGRMLKFVPASGAATRMFLTLLARRNRGGPILRDETAALAASGDRPARELLAFMDGLPRFAFFGDLAAVVARTHHDIAQLMQGGEFTPVLDALLGADGLDYAALPKGLLKFHRYPDGGRTPFEEHLVEAAACLRDGGGVCRVHFTVSPEHEDRFRRLLDAVRSSYERRYAARFEVAFSVQKRSTDTIAVDLHNRPFRTASGDVLFRPGGHGALIENLNDLRSDIVFINNIDNVVPDRLKPPVIASKKALAGHLIALQARIFRWLSELHAAAVSRAVLDEATAFATRALGLTVPAASPTDEARRAWLVRALDRPIRVCGMVRNTGEPGGGPFWVRGRDGEATRQIVEGAQVDPDAPDQQAIFQAATHFNPVDLVCGLRNWRGEPFDLRRFVDPEAVFISQKSQDGRSLKALELPGLWNGAMAWWTTLFVAVSSAAFNPVKTINDLLRLEHQPE